MGQPEDTLAAAERHLRDEEGPKAVTVRYRYSEGDEEYRSASYRGLFYECTEAAVRRRLREVHRFAKRLEIVEVRWHAPHRAAAEPPQRGNRT